MPGGTEDKGRLSRSGVECVPIVVLVEMSVEGIRVLVEAVDNDADVTSNISN